ncbi:GMC oxidoreductase [Saccharata proteae CBS 121410]|uniref:GMC oxidoreductase n=1 Tax=Saccharata proteae CBS 121410 TaxID=1314787 RepID=A0A9P4HR93_9PEZI|nr:GMC oxidoreductase [Saccharata proteae CBS 121410]
MSEYDFIVVGSGPAGATLASLLSRTPSRPSILLLEAGGPNASLDTRLLSERYTTFLSGGPAMNWGYQTAPQRALNGRSFDYSRGKGLGGSSAINFACWTVGPAEDYDEWARLVGDEGFSWENAKRRYKRLETYDFEIADQHRDYVAPRPEDHGSRGPVQIEFAKEWERSFQDVLDAGRAVGMEVNRDANSGSPLGIAVVPATSRRGVRSTARSAFLEDAPSNLTILTEAPVERVVFEGKRAVAVKTGSKTYTARKEIILSAGALDTPKLLLLSGVGPAHELSAHNITPIHHLPGVGKNLQDHPFFSLIVRLHPGTNNRSTLFNDPAALAAAKQQFHADGSGPLALFYNSIIMGWAKSSHLFSTPEFAALSPDAQNHLRKPGVPTFELVSHGPAFHAELDPKEEYLAVMPAQFASQSRGQVTLASADPAAPPVCDPNIFSVPFDRLNMISAVRAAITLLDSPILKKEIAEGFDVPKSDSDEDIWAFVQERCGTMWHMSCTAKMGKEGDESAVVDSRFRVMGLEGLRVVDASVLPFVPNCHIVSVVYMIGAAAAEKLIVEYDLTEGMAEPVAKI